MKEKNAAGENKEPAIPSQSDKSRANRLEPRGMRAAVRAFRIDLFRPDAP
jgi:hypothetical protein